MTTQSASERAPDNAGDLFDSAPAAMLKLTADGTIVVLTPLAAKLLGRVAGGCAGRRFGDFVSQADQAEWGAFLRQVFADGEAHSCALDLAVVSGPSTGIRVQASRTPAGDECVAIAMETAGQRPAEHLLKAQRDLLELVASGAPLKKSLEALARSLESLETGILCSVLLLDEDGVHLRHGAAPSLPAAYCQAIDGMAIGPSAGSCGTAAYRREPVWVEDIATDSLWRDFRAFALPLGLRACWSSPILNPQGRVLGTFALYYRKPAAPSPRQLDIIRLATHLAAIAIGRHEAEAALRVSDAALRSISKGVIISTPEGVILSANPAFTTITGYTTEDVLGRNFQVLLSSVPPAMLEAIHRAHHQGLEFNGEFLDQRKDGVRFWNDLTIAPVRDEDGAITHYLGINRDVTARRQAEESLRHSETRIRLLLRAASLGLWEWNLLTNETYFSPEWKQQLGYGENELANHFEEWRQRVHPADLEATLAAIGDFREGRRATYDVEFRLRHRDGSWRWMFSRADFIRDPEGRPVRMLGCHFDITDRKQAEEALRESEQRLAFALDATRDGIWDWDIPSGRVYFSPQWARSLGYAPEEPPQRVEFFYEILHPEDAPLVQSALEEHFAGRKPIKQDEVRLRLKNGEYRWFDDRGKIVSRDPAGRPLRMVGTITDITERKRDARRIATYARLGHDLNEASTIQVAGRLIATAADELIGWDSANLLMFDESSGLCRSVLRVEAVDGVKADVPDDLSRRPPSARMLRTMRQGAELVLGDDPFDAAVAEHPIVEADPAPVSRLHVPIRVETATVGVLSIAANRPRAYETADLATLQSLAEFGGGALLRILGRDALKQGEERLREAQALAHIGNFHWDALTNQVTWSEELFHIYGRDRDRFQPSFEAYVGAVHEEDRPRVLEALRRATGGLQSFSHDYRVVLADGAVRWVHALGNPVADANGRLLGLEGTCQDITGRKLAEARDRHSLSMLLATLESTADGILVVNTRGGIETYNKVFARMWGLSEEVLATRDDARALQCAIDQLVQPREFLAKVTELYARPEAESFDTVAFKDGRVFERYSRPQYVDGLVVGRVWSFSDVTENHRAAATVRESEARFRLLFEGAKDAIFWADAESGVITQCNAAGETLLGRPRSEIIGRHQSFLHPPGEANRYEKLFKSHASLGESSPVEAEVVRRDGRRTPVLISTSVTTIGTQRVIQGIFHDISERKAAEMELRSTEARFRELAENIQEVFWTSNVDKGQVLYVSPAYEKVWGRPCSDLYLDPKNWLEAVHPDDQARVLTAAQTRQVSGEYDETYRIRRPDGTERWIRDRAFPVRDAGGQVCRIVGTATDITAQRQLEDQLRESQKMEAIGQLAGGVAHDFNNIMSAMLLQTELTAEDDSLSDEAREGLREIRDSVQRAANLTRQLLAFSRRQVMQVHEVDINEVVSRLIRMLQRVLREDVELRLNLAPRALPTNADAGMLDQVLINLAVNAREAMPRGGRLTIETGQVTLTEAEVGGMLRGQPGPHVFLRVSDTGMGIAPENLPHIFEPFFTTKEVGKGTGLGLATVFGIVRQHGGAISVESKVGIGTTFTVHLPAREVGGPDAVGPMERPREGRNPSGGAETILLVEDSPHVRKLAQIALTRAGYRILEAADGVEALEVVKAHPGRIDLLLTDLVMPNGLNGRELARLLEVEHPGLRVVFTSGYSAEVAGCDLDLRAGQNFLPKPASVRQLLDIVRHRLDH